MSEENSSERLGQNNKMLADPADYRNIDHLLGRLSVVIEKWENEQNEYAAAGNVWTARGIDLCLSDLRNIVAHY